MNAMRALAMGLVWLAAPASADLLVPVAQARSVTAQASEPSGTPSYESLAAPDFARFTAHASAASGTTGFDSASANQDSAIGADRIDGSCSATSLIDRPAHLGSGRGTCIIDVTFDVAEAVTYQVSLTFSYGPNPDSEDELVLSGPDGEVFPRADRPNGPDRSLRGVTGCRARRSRTPPSGARTRPTSRTSCPSCCRARACTR